MNLIDKTPDFLRALALAAAKHKGSNSHFTGTIVKPPELLNPNEALPEKFKGKTLMQLHSEDLLEEFKLKFPNQYEELKMQHSLKKK